MSRLPHFEQATLDEDDSSDSPPEEGNDALCDEILALREEVAMLRRTDIGTTSHDTNSRHDSQTNLPDTMMLCQNSAALTEINVISENFNCQPGGRAAPQTRPP